MYNSSHSDNVGMANKSQLEEAPSCEYSVSDMDNDIVWGNWTFKDMVRNKPYGWIMMNPPLIKHYGFESRDPYPIFTFIESNKIIAFYVGALYLLAIFGLQLWMKNRPAFNLRRPLLYWNALLGIFSLVVCVRTAPSYLYTLSRSSGIYSSICIRENMDIPTGFWSFVFVLSKFVELGDTIFIVLRKRPLQFIQWFHHLTIVIVGWLTFPFAEPVLRYNIVVNSGIHALMYPYFALMGAGIKVPKPIANFITTIQFVQMIIGFGINLASMYYWQTGANCYRHPLSIKIWVVLWGMFIFMFGKLFYDNVIVGGKHKKKAE